MDGDVLLPYGRFFGDLERRREVAGAALASLVARVPEDEVTRHTHEEAHFVLVTAGCYLSSAAGAPELGGPSTLIYNPPGTTHRDRFRDGAGGFFTVSLDRVRLAHMGEAVALPRGPVWIGQPAALAAATRLARECAAWDDAAVLAVDGLIWALVEATSAVRAAPAGRASWLLRVRDRLHDECSAPLALQALAAGAGVHPGHLTRSFRRAFGCTPGEYLRVCRTERAARLVRETRAPLADIAAGCGFSDQSHMTRALRRHAGVTPGRARRFVSF